MWQSPHDNLTLPADEVHIWRVWLHTTSVQYLELLEQTLAADEHARAQRFYFAKDRTAFIVARGTLRVVLGRYLRIPPQQVQFAYTPNGKPELAHPTAGNQSLNFNVSHSQSLALYACCWNRAVGVDVEYLRPIAQDDRIAQRFFLPQEYTAWQSLPPAQQQLGFFNCWTRKEAFLKARGVGLANELTSVEVSLKPGEAAEIRAVAAGNAAQWSLLELVPASGYVGALVVEGVGWRVQYWEEPS
jgi:4'-phosphopantetheinyl transferase